MSSPPTAGRTNGTRGRANGLVNGMGRTNGLVNGVGRTNGLVTGIGYVNGVRLRLNTHGVIASSDVRRTVVFIASAIVVMLLAGFFLGVQEPPGSLFAVDADFSEWTSVAKYVDPTEGIPGHVDLVAYAFHEEPGRLFVYGRTRSPMFPGNDTSSLYLLIDDPALSGYVVEGFDADYVAEAWGWGGQMRESVLREWTGDPDRDNATSLRSRGSFPAASAGTEFEILLTEAAIDLDLSRDLRLAIASRHDDALDGSLIVGRRPGALQVVQRPLTGVVATTTAVLELRVQASLANVQIRSLSFDHAGGGSLVVPASSFTVAAGAERVELIGLDPAALPSGSFVTVRLRSVDAVVAGTTEPIPATIAGPSARLYVQAVPAGFVIDGVFDEWSGAASDPDEAMPASIDLLGSAFALRTDAFFFVRTEGTVLTGALLPERRGIPAPPGGNATPSPPVPIPRQAGEDILQVYVDSDAGDAVGFPIGGILSDRLLEVRGRAGRITSSGLFAWNDTRWEWDRRSGPFNIAFEGARLEASTDLTFFGTLSNTRAVFAMTDWASRRDTTDIPRASSGPSLLMSATGPTPQHALPPDEIDATPLVNVPAIDGRCNSFLGEYAGASSASNPSLEFFVGRRDDTQFLFVCIRVTADTRRNNFDWGEVIFDRKHDGGLTPQADDLLFWVYGDGDNVLKIWEGTGGGWDTDNLCALCDPGDDGVSRFATIEVYEFQIRYTDVWGTLLPLPDQVAGFAIIAYDWFAAVLHTWGGPAVDENIPDSWGHLYYPIIIPEFPMPVLAAITVVLIPILRSRRSRAAEE